MTALAAAIKKVATGPHLSKDLLLQEADEAMTEILLGDADPVQAAVFLIALRIKRETNDENTGILQAIQRQTMQTNADVDKLLIVSDPYDGYNRHCPVHAFLPAVLAASGLPTLSQGTYTMGPKFGVTHARVLTQAGVVTDLSLQSATDRINNPEISWAYLDEAQASPDLYALQELRTRMIKRPCLATLEKLIMPIKAAIHTYLQVGFVHKAYPPILALLANRAGFISALIVRGVEGGILPTLRDASTCFTAHAGDIEPYQIDPTTLGIQASTRGVLPQVSGRVTVSETAERGLKALAGQTGAAFDSLVLGGAMALHHCGLRPTVTQAADHIRKTINSGRARAFFAAAIN